MTNLLRIGCWNCRGVMTAVPYLLELLQTHNLDIIALSEHWLRSCQIGFLDSIDNINYSGYGKGVDDSQPHVYKTKNRGGVAFLVAKRLCPFIEELDIPYDRITGLVLNIPESENIYFLSVYMPASSQPYEYFASEMEMLFDYYSMYSDLGKVIIMGDFNCKMNGARYTVIPDRRSNLANNFMRQHNLISMHLLNKASGPICTFQSYADGPSTPIDHIVTHIDNIGDISQINVIDEELFNVSDHKPIMCNVQIHDVGLIGKNSDDVLSKRKVNWRKAIETYAIVDYSYAVSQFLWATESPDITSTEDKIDDYYKTIVRSIQQASDETLPHKLFSKCLKPYWTNIVKNLHSEMRWKRSCWIANGKSHDRTNVYYIEYKASKLNFRKELNKAYYTYLQELSTKIEESVDKDQRLVWSMLKSRRKQTPSCSKLEMNGSVYSTEDEIRNAWATHFGTIFQYDRDLVDQENERNVIDQVHQLYQNALDNRTPIDKFTFSEVYDACTSLPRHKSSGLNDITYEHLKFGGRTLSQHLCNLFNLCLKRSYIPK